MKRPHPSILLPLAIALLSPFATIAQGQSIAPRLMPRPATGRETLMASNPIRFMPPPPPPGDAPTGRVRGGASRNNCPMAAVPLTALVPATVITTSKSASPTTTVWGMTVAAHPAFWFYIPYAAPVAKRAHYTIAFSLQDDTGTAIYKSTLLPPQTPGVIKVAVPSTVAPLKPGIPYRWYLNIYCNRQQTAPTFVEGMVQRQTPNADLTQITASQPRDRAQLYAAHGIWFDALTTLAELRLAHPQDPTLKADWQALLRSAGVAEPVINAPLLP